MADASRILRRVSLDIKVAVFFLTLVLILKANTLGLPYYEDGLSLYVPAAQWISENSMNPFPPDNLGAGHPPLFLFILAISFSVLGRGLFVGHMVIMLFCFVAVFFTYLCGKEMHDARTGFIAASLLLFSPLFFAQSGMVNVSVPLAAMTMVTFYLMLKRRLGAYILSASALILFHELGVYAVFIMGIYMATKREWLYLSPCSVYVVWMTINAHVYGYLLNPIQTTCFNGFSTDAFVYSFFWVFLSGYKWVLSITAICSAWFTKERLRNGWVPIVIVLFYVFFFSFSGSNMPFTPRYLMQSLPFFFIIVASTLKGIKKRYVYGLVLVIILLFIASWNGTGSTGVFKETNMGYSDFVLANADAIKYIEENHPNARILVDSDNRELFLSPDYGYVTSPKDIVVVHGLRDDPLQGFEIIYHTPRIDIPQSIDDINAFARRIGYIECEDGKIGDYVKNSMHYYLYEHDTVIIGIFERNGQRVEIRKPV